jgi:hypothetical protein
LDHGKGVVANSQERSWDFNYTDDTLEVLNGDDKVVLQIRVLPERIQLAGEAWNADGEGIRIVPKVDLSVKPASGVSVVLLVRHKDHKYDPTEPHIVPIFSYPNVSAKFNNLGRYARPSEDPQQKAQTTSNVIYWAVLIYGGLVFIAPLSLAFCWLKEPWPFCASPPAASSRDNVDVS